MPKIKESKLGNKLTGAVRLLGFFCGFPRVVIARRSSSVSERQGRRDNLTCIDKNVNTRRHTTGVRQPCGGSPRQASLLRPMDALLVMTAKTDALIRFLRQWTVTPIVRFDFAKGPSPSFSSRR